MDFFQPLLAIIAAISTAVTFRLWAKIKVIQNSLSKQSDLVHSLKETNVQYKAKVKETATSTTPFAKKSTTPERSQRTSEKSYRVTVVSEKRDTVFKSKPRSRRSQKEIKAIDSSMETVIAQQNTRFSLDLLAISSECERLHIELQSAVKNSDDKAKEIARMKKEQAGERARHEQESARRAIIKMRASIKEKRQIEERNRNRMKRETEIKRLGIELEAVLKVKCEQDDELNSMRARERVRSQAIKVWKSEQQTKGHQKDIQLARLSRITRNQLIDSDLYGALEQFVAVYRSQRPTGVSRWSTQVRYNSSYKKT